MASEKMGDSMISNNDIISPDYQPTYHKSEAVSNIKLKFPPNQ